MSPPSRSPSLGLLVLAWALALVVPSQPARASCNAIPAIRQEFRGALGALSRPYAIPLNEGEEISISLSPMGCPAAPGFVDSGAPGSAGDYLVTFLFEPTSAGEPASVSLASTTNLAACESKAAAAPGNLVAFCLPVDGGTRALRVVDEFTLSFVFPDTDALLALDGQADENDDRTFTGPATIAVTHISDPLPFALATGRCADTPSPGLVACVDELYEDDGTCGTARLHPVFPHFTALPMANDFEVLCTPDGNECEGIPGELRFAVDAGGNVLVPFDWRGVLLRPDGVPLARIVRVEAQLEAAPGGEPLALPSRSFVTSHSTGGSLLHPFFQPELNPDAPQQLRLSGSVDAEISVVRMVPRVANRSSGVPVFGQCASDSSVPCSEDADCGPGDVCANATCHTGSVDTGVQCLDDDGCEANQTCGPVLFDLRFLATEGGVGPGVLPVPSIIRAFAESPVPLDGLLDSPDLLAFVEFEQVADTEGEVRSAANLNFDGDMLDPVLIIRDRRTGTVQPTGRDAGAGPAAGRAIVRIQEPPFRYAALDAEGPLVAFLEPEPLEGDCYEGGFPDELLCDHNGDGDAFDTLLRFYRVEAPCAAGESTCASDIMGRVAFLEGRDATELSADAAPVIDGRALRISGGTLFARIAEAGNTVDPRFRRLLRPDPTDVGLISGNGRFATIFSQELGAIVYDLRDGSHVPAPTPGSLGAMSWTGRYVLSGFSVHDRDADGNGVFDEPGGVETVPIASESSELVDLSPNGRFVSYMEGPDLWLHDRDSDDDGVFDEVGATDARLVASGVEHRRGSVSNEGDVAMLADAPSNALLLFDSVDGSIREVLDAIDWDEPPLLTAAGDLLLFTTGRTDRVPSTSVLTLVAWDRESESFSRVGSRRLISPFNEALSRTGRYSLSLQGGFVATLTDLATGMEREFGTEGSYDVSDVGPRVLRTRLGLKREVSIIGPDLGDTDWDLNGDGDVEDTMLVAVSADDAALHVLGPAGAASVANGAAAFLWRDGATPPWMAGEVHLWTKDGGVAGLEREATEVVLTDRLVAGLAHEDGSNWVYVAPLDAPRAWQRLTPAASEFRAQGGYLAFRGADDRLLYVYDLDADAVRSAGLPASEFVIGTELVAFRVPERTDAGECQAVNAPGDRNGDRDDCDRVLHAFDLATGTVVPSGQAATPCQLEPCDPRLPYRTAGSNVTFLTWETEQGGADLDGDGDGDGLVLQTFNAAPFLGRSRGFLDAAPASVAALGGIAAGVCTDTRAACASHEHCDNHYCLLPPGSCIEDRGTACSCDASGCVGCAPDEFCARTSDGPAEGVCQAEVDALGGLDGCSLDSQCPASANCRDAGDSILNLLQPIRTGASADQAFVTREGERLVVRGAPDSDGDSIIDPLDNCPFRPNPEQLDGNDDGVGDACTRLAPLSGAASARVKLRFDKEGRDRVDVSVKRWSLPGGFQVAGASLSVSLADSALTGMLDAKGKWKSPDGRDRMKLKQSRQGDWKLRASRRKRDLAEDFAPVGMRDEDHPKPGRLLAVPLRLVAGDEAGEETLALRYRSKAGKQGTAKPAKR